jgi:hypothetical protein
VEIQGLTPVDTIYGFVGHTVGFRLGTYLIWEGFLVFFVVAAGFIRLYYLSSQKGSFAELGTYPLYVFFLLFLLYPIEVSLTAPRAPNQAQPGGAGAMANAEKLQVPRILAYVCSLSDALQQRLIGDVRGMVGNTLREWERLAAVNEKARIMNVTLRQDLAIYVKHCYWPTLAQDGSPKGEPWDLVPLAFLDIDEWLVAKYDEINLLAPRTALNNQPIPCTGFHRWIFNLIVAELKSDPAHALALAAYAGADVPGSEAWNFYRRRILYNEIYVLAPGAAAAVRTALPEYSIADPTTMSVQATQSRGVWANAWSFLSNFPAIAASTASAFGEWWSQKAMGSATYYRVSALAPHIYGMTIGLLFMLFPVAGLMAFWPKWWTAIVNFMKVLISVKLWPILWALLSAILSSRNVFDGTNPNGFDSGLGNSGVFPAICSMYLIVPALSFMIVNIAHHAGGGMLGMLIAGSEGASIGEARGLGGSAGSIGGSVFGGAGRLAQKGWNVIRSHRNGSGGGSDSGGGGAVTND